MTLSLVLLLAWSASALAFGPSLRVGHKGVTYYVNTSGSDSNSGTQPDQAWQTLTKVSARVFHAYDVIRFNGGQSFSGGIAWTTANTFAPITVNSYGAGQATISSGNSTAGLSSTNLSGLTINNLIFTGGGIANNTTAGLVIKNNEVALLGGPTINNVTVSGYGQDCIQITASNNFGFNNVSITNNTVHDCTGKSGTLTAGINVNVVASASPALTSFTNITVTGNTIYNITGHAGAANWTGTGIWVNGATGVNVSNNVVHDSGSLSSTAAGPSGILFDSVSNIVCNKNEIYNISTAGGDGDGIDFDGRINNAVMQYNYTHGNKGVGLFVYSFGAASNNITIDFNISQNDGIGLDIDGSVNQITNTYVYNNTFYSNVANGKVVSSTGTVTATISNNIFYSLTSGGVVLYVATPSSQTFTENNYYGNGPFYWNGTSYSTFAAWQTASGQEKIGGVNVGHTVEPRLVVYGGGGTTGGYVPASLPQYQLQSGSPMLSAGLNLTTQYGIVLPATDYYGGAITASALPVGAGQQVIWINGTGTCSQATTALGRMSSPPTTTQQQVNAIICGGIADGWWSVLDAFYKLASDSATDAKLNLVNTSFGLTPHGTIPFTANVGYVGDGSTGYIDTGYTPSTAGGNQTQNSALIMAYVVASRTSPATATIIGNTNSLSTTGDAILPLANFGGDHAVLQINEVVAGSVFVSSTNAQGIWLVSRTASTTNVGFLNGGQIGTDSTASSALPNESLFIAAQNTQGSPTQFSADSIGYAAIGGGMTAASGLPFYMAYRINADATALGINAF